MDGRKEGRNSDGWSGEGTSRGSSREDAGGCIPRGRVYSYRGQWLVQGPEFESRGWVQRDCGISSRGRATISVRGTLEVETRASRRTRVMGFRIFFFYPLAGLAVEPWCRSLCPRYAKRIRSRLTCFSCSSNRETREKRLR